MKKIIVDAYLAKNFGDDLFLYILFKRYSNSNVMWIVNTYDIDYINIFKEFSNVKINIKNKFEKGIYKISCIRNVYYKNEAKNVDGLLIIGGSIFMQNSTWQNQFKRFRDRLNNYRKLNKKIFVLGSNFGPFKDERFIEYYRTILSKCDYVCFRDSYSYNLFKDYKNIRYASDIVFSLDEKIDSINRDGIGISLIEINGKSELEKNREKYLNYIINMINYLNLKGENVKLLSFCTEQGDTNIAKEVYSKIDNKEKVKILNYNGEIKNFLLELYNLKGIIGTRFHSIILSQVFKQGVYPIIYSQKTINMLNDLNLKDYYLDLNKLNEEINLEDIFNILENNKIDNIYDLKKEGENQFIKLDEFINREEMYEDKK